MQRDREEEGQRKGGGREGELSEAGSRALVNNPPPYVMSRRQCRFRRCRFHAAIGQPGERRRGLGEGRRQGEEVIYVAGRESNTKEEGSGAFFLPGKLE